MYYRIDQAKYNEAGEVKLVEIGKYNPTATIVLEMYEDPEFEGGSNEFPPSLRKEEELECPFADIEVEENKFGLLLSILIPIIITFLAFGLAVKIYRKLKLVGFERLEVRRPMQIYDFLILVLIPIETIQMASIGPNFSGISKYLYYLSQTFTINFQNFHSLKNG